MVHIITMLTYIAQIDIGEYKNPFKCPETTLVTLGSSGIIFGISEEIPEMLPDNGFE